MRTLVLLLSCGWLFAQTIDSPFVAAAVCVTAIASCAALGLHCRQSIVFVVFLCILSLLIAAFLTYCLIGTFTSGGGFIVQVIFLLLLAPLVPLFYALSFPTKPR
jgi:hypothetical protein